MKNKIKVTFSPIKKEIELSPKKTIFDAAIKLHLPINSYCGGAGWCGKCKIKILKGNLGIDSIEERFLTEKEKKSGIRLACRKTLKKDTVVRLLREDVSFRHDFFPDDKSIRVSLDCGINKYFIRLDKRAIEKKGSLWSEIKESLPEKTSFKKDLSIAKSIKKRILDSDGGVTVVLHDSEVIAFEKEDTTSKKFGLSFDIGTTTLAGYLVDLNDGSTLKALSASNSQRIFGADIISRINFASDLKGLKKLQKAVVKDIESIIERLVSDSEVSRANIYSGVFVGNAAMHHLFLGIDPSSLGVSPYKPAVKEGIEFGLRELGIKLGRKIKGYFLPNIDGFVGSDALATILATGIYQREDLSLIIDIGTNGETILGNRKKILCGSNAAGPAFEGASIRYGMLAEKGAIDRYKANQSGIKFHVLGDRAPKGICGSGMIDAIASLLKMGIITPKGSLIKQDKVNAAVPRNVKKRVVMRREGHGFQLTKKEESYNKRPLYLLQKDIREIQLAKGAIAAGIKLLFKEFKIGIDDISNIFITGSFGNFIDPENGIEIGLIPNISLKKIRFLSNAAGIGAKLVLISKEMRKIAEGLAEKIEHINFAGRKDYQDIFFESLHFKKLF